MVQLKDETSEIGKVSYNKHKTIKLKSFVYSYDKDIGKLILPICSVDNTSLFDNIEEVFYLMVGFECGQQISVQKKAIVEGNNVIVNIPEELRGYSGVITMGLYFKLTTGQQIDGVKYSFNMVLSDIDKNIPELEAFYYSKFEDVLLDFTNELQNILSQIEIDVNEQVLQITESLNVLQTDIENAKTEITDIESTLQDIINRINNLPLDQIQMKKITADTGGSIATVSSGNSLLSFVVNKGLGLYTLDVSASASDVPRISSAYKAIVNITTANTSGNVMLISESGRFFVRTFKNNVFNTDWVELASSTTTQMKKITADTGGRLSTITSGSILDYLLSNTGVQSLASTNNATDHPPTTSPFRFIANMNDSNTGNVIGVTDNGDFYFRSIRAKNWSTPWGTIPTATPKMVYVSNQTGLDTNIGTKENPFKTLSKALTSGAETIVLEKDIYEERIYTTVERDNLTIIGNGSTIMGSVEITPTAEGNLLKYPYVATSGSRMEQVFITKTLTPIGDLNKQGYNVGLWEITDNVATTNKLKPVLTLAELTEGTFHYDGVNIIINPFTTTSVAKQYRLHLDTALFRLWNIKNLKISDLNVLYGYGGVFDIDNNSNVELNNCQASYSSNGDGFSVDRTNGIFNKCVAIRNSNDGFNFHDYGHTILNDCNGSYNYDDGNSHHNNCTGTIEGGEWSYNGKGGCSPALGAIVNIYNTHSHHNNYGIYFLSSGNAWRNGKFFGNVLNENNLADLIVQGNTAELFNTRYTTSTFSDGADKNLIQY